MKILVVEDNKTISSILKMRLEKEGFAIDIIEGGFALLAYIKNSAEPDAIILDLFLPEKSGMELVDTIVGRWQKAKIFIYSAQTKWKKQLLRYPSVYSFFSKTEDMTDLIKAIKEELSI